MYIKTTYRVGIATTSPVLTRTFLGATTDLYFRKENYARIYVCTQIDTHKWGRDFARHFYALPEENLIET